MTDSQSPKPPDEAFESSNLPIEADEAAPESEPDTEAETEAETGQESEAEQGADPSNESDVESTRQDLRDLRWKVARDLIVFQGKLALDAIRDLALAPVAIGAALLGVVSRPDNPGVYFYDLMRWGRRSDKFINLFSAGQDPEEKDNFPSVDDLVTTVEEAIVKEHEKGGMTAEAKSHIDKTLDKLDEAMERDRERTKRHIKVAADTMKREIKKVKNQIAPPADEPPAPSA